MLLFHSMCLRVDDLSLNLFCPLPFVILFLKMLLLNRSDVKS